MRTNPGALLRRTCMPSVCVIVCVCVCVGGGGGTLIYLKTYMYAQCLCVGGGGYSQLYIYQVR